MKAKFLRRVLCPLLALPTVLGGIILLLFIAWPAARSWPAQLLVAADPTKTPADAILLLMGDVEDRTPYAAALWQAGYAPKILLMETDADDLAKAGLRPADGEVSFQYLQKLGIPASAILYKRGSAVSSTIEEGQELFAWVGSELPDAKRLIICTSWYHSSRAMWIMQRLNAAHYDLRSRPTPMPRVWYAVERNFLSVFNEYLKWLYYLIKY